MFYDDFSTYPATNDMDVDRNNPHLGPWRENSMHYSWVKNDRPIFLDNPIAWRVIEIDGETLLDQAEAWPNVTFHAGEDLWDDYTLEAELIPQTTEKCGLLFRYLTSRNNYYLAVEGGTTLQVIRHDDDEHVLLAAAPCAYTPGQRLTLKVTLLADRISVACDGRDMLTMRDNTYLHGKIGLRTDGPARYGWVRVTASEAAEQRLATKLQHREQILAGKKERFASPQLVHQIALNNHGNYLHLADLTGEGKTQIVFVGQQCTGPDKTRITQVGVMDLEGEILWEQGEMLESSYPFHSDVPFNFGDIDGDGKAELLIVQDNIFRIIDSSTGDVKNEMPVPTTDSGEPMCSDSILIADLRGKGRKSDILLKDRYTNIWAFTCDLQPLWHRTLNTGHFPRAADINGDGREEVMAGYSMLSAEGETMWTVPGADPIHNVWEEAPHSEHADSIWLGRPDGTPEAPVRVVIAASDMGLLVLDAVSGELLHRERCGHAQSLGVARFRPDLPGYQFMVSNLWGNAGLTTLCDAQGRKLVSREFARFGIMLPLNWRNDGEVYIYNWNTREVYDRDLDTVHTFAAENEAGFMARPFVDDFLGRGTDQVLCVRKDRLEFYAADAVENTTPIARHDTENFNSYGAFFLESLKDG